MEANKKIVQLQWQRFNEGNMEETAGFFSPGTKNHGIPVGREGIMFVMKDIRNTFPDVLFIPVDMFAEGDWVITRGILKGTFKNKATIPHHGGLLMAHEPTHQSFAVQHIHMFKVENNLITEHYASRDDVDMYQQLGLLPSPPKFVVPAIPGKN